MKSRLARPTLFPLLFGGIGLLLLCGCSTTRSIPVTPPPAPDETALPLTISNLRSHKMLYDEGWWVVSSSRKALEFARAKGIDSSAAALQRARLSLAERSRTLGSDLTGDVKSGVTTTIDIVKETTQRSGDILATTHELGTRQLHYADESFSKAMDLLVKGNLSLSRRTADERQALAALPGDYYRDLKSDFSNLWELTGKVNDAFANRIEVGWDAAFARAGTVFRTEYERSGEQPNTLLALGPILAGYLKAFYHGLAAPTAKSIVKVGVKGATDAVFLPTAGVTLLAGRTVQSVGLSIYHVGKTGVEILSPTVEAGLLSGLSLLSLGAVPVTYVTGGTLGALNQVAFTPAAPVAGTARAVGEMAYDSGKYVSFVTYDIARGTTEVVINAAQSAVVLGYNAITAVPSHLVLGTVDLFVLAWEGPQLILYRVNGSVDGAAVGELPVGTVIDIEAARRTPGLTVERLSDDPRVIEDVLHKLPDDLRLPPAAPEVKP